MKYVNTTAAVKQWATSTWCQRHTVPHIDASSPCWQL